MKPERIPTERAVPTGPAVAEVAPPNEPPTSELKTEASTPEPHARPKASRGRRAFLVLGGVVGTLLLAIGGYAWMTHGQESTDDAEVDAGVVTVAPRVAGTIERVLVHDNTSVHAGDVIAVLDTSDLDARLASARAELASAEAQRHAAEAQERIVEANATGGLTTARAAVSGARVAASGASDSVAQARAELDRAQVDAQRAQLDYDRMQRLSAAGAVSTSQVDNARLANESAQAALARARSGVSGAEAQRRSVVTQVSAAEGRLAQSAPVDAQVDAARAATELATARVEQARAALSLAELALAHAEITSPLDGTISNLDAEPGRIVSVGQALATVVPDETYVVANFKETQVGEMRPGDRAEIDVDAYPGRTFEGVVESIAAGTGASFSVLPSNNATGNFVKVVQRVPVRIAWRSQPDVPLRVGLSATATVYVGDHAARSPRSSGASPSTGDSE